MPGRSRRPAPPPGGDWRRRMRVRGGWPQHALARFGWLVVGAAVGAVFAVFGLIGVAVSDDPTGPTGFGGAVAVVVGSFLLFGLPAALFVGLPVQYATRAWLRSPNADEREAMRVAQGQARSVQPPGLRAGSWWSGAYGDCVGAVTAFHAVVRTLPDGAARTWFTDIGRRLEWELDEALRLAQLGEGIDSGAPGGSAARTIADRLEGARAAFARTTDRAATIALDLRVDSGFDDVAAQLDVLAAQAPHLRGHP